MRKKLYLEYIKHYVKITSTNDEQIEQWKLPVAAARLIEGILENEK